MRSNDYKTDVNFYLPKFLVNDPAFAETQRTLSWEHEQYRLKVIDFAKQFHPQTATWGLKVWEEELGLTTDLSVDMELRRAKVMAKLLGASPMTVANTNKLVNLFTNDGKAYVDELPEDGVIKIVIPSKTTYLDEMRDSLDEMLPAHLVYDFQHVIHIDDEDSDEDNGSPDEININDESGTDINSAFFMHAEFPITENIPYGSRIDALKYDGSVQVNSPNQFSGALQYNGVITYDGIASDTAQVSKPISWWLIQTGESTYNKEFQHDGAIRYDGLKPQKIEYDNGIDELNTLEITQVYEDKFSDSAQYDGVHRYDGVDLNQSPADVGGDLEIKRYKRFDGAARYNGGDINYYNGSIRYDGKFNFEGDGNKAQVKIISDNLNGDVDILKPVKEIPLSNYYPELFDLVQRTFDEQDVEVLVGTFEDTVAPAIEDCNQTTISKVMRYDGAKNYDGGDMNYYNGAIKANGKFNFEGNGNHAKVEVIAVDLDNSFSLRQLTKSTPINYLDLFDYVSRTYDENYFSAQLSLSDEINSVNDEGNLVIRRRLRYDGIANYGGNFEYHDRRRFDGTLNYNGVHKVKSNGTSRFNGIELYGERRNIKRLEMVDEIGGSLTWQQLPIATREKLGMIIIGHNIDVDANGKITMPKMKEIPSGKIKEIFNSRRN